VLKSDGE
jgi:hypothetical protein